MFATPRVFCSAFCYSLPFHRSPKMPRAIYFRFPNLPNSLSNLLLNADSRELNAIPLPLFLIVFLESKVVKSMSNAPTCGRLPTLHPHLPISGLLTCSRKRKNWRFFKERWKAASSKSHTSIRILRILSVPTFAIFQQPNRATV